MGRQLKLGVKGRLSNQEMEQLRNQVKLRDEMAALDDLQLLTLLIARSSCSIRPCSRTPTCCSSC